MNKLAFLVLLNVFYLLGSKGLPTCSVPGNSDLINLVNHCPLQMWGIHNSGNLPLHRYIENYDVIKFKLAVDGTHEKFHFALTTHRVPGESLEELFSMTIVWGEHGSNYNDVYFNNQHYDPWSDSLSFPFKPPALEWLITIKFFPENKITIIVDGDIQSKAVVYGNLEGAHDFYYHGQNSRVCGKMEIIGFFRKCETLAPTPAPTSSPTDAPTNAPTKSPTPAPTSAPTASPTRHPTKAPIDRCYKSCFQFQPHICKIAGTRRSSFEICGPHSDLDIAVLKMSQSNHMYAKCESLCVYDFNDIDGRAWRWNEKSYCFDMVYGGDHQCYVINNDDWRQVTYIRGHICADCLDMVYDIDTFLCSPHYDKQRKTILNCATKLPDLQLYLAQANQYYPTCSSTCLYRFNDKYIFKLKEIDMDGVLTPCYDPVGDTIETECSNEQAIYDMDVLQASVCNYEAPTTMDFCQLLLYGSDDFSRLLSPPQGAGFGIGSFDCFRPGDFLENKLRAIRLIGSKLCRFKIKRSMQDNDWECEYNDGPGEYPLSTLIGRGICKNSQKFQPSQASHVDIWLANLHETDEEKETAFGTGILMAIARNAYNMKLITVSVLFILFGIIMFRGIKSNEKDLKVMTDEKMIPNEYTPLMEMA